jgi:hypothetical protein
VNRSRIQFLLIAGLSLAACRKSETDKSGMDEAASSVKDSLARVPHNVMVPNPNQPDVHKGPRGAIADLKYQKKDVDSLFNLPLASRPADPKAALMGYLNTVPPPFGVPPYLMPPGKIKEEAKSSALAIYTVQGQHAPMRARVTLEKRKQGSDSLWIIQRVEDLGPELP